MNILFGIYSADEGEIFWKGKQVHFHSPKDAIAEGIGMVHQHFSLVNKMTVLDNVILGLEKQGFFLDRKSAKKSLEDLAERYGLQVDPDARISDLSVGQQQRVEILKALYRNVELLILDEPINGLDPIGIAEIRTFIEDLSKNRGKTILISSHILSEIAVLADDIGIIDKGVLIEEGSMKELEEKNGKYIHFKVSDNAQAARILSVYYKESNFKVSGNQDINVYNLSISIPDIVRSFVQEGVDVMAAHLCEDTLEDYFKKVTGGEGIA